MMLPNCWTICANLYYGYCAWCVVSPIPFKCVPQIQRYLKHYNACRKKNVVIRPFVTVHRNIRFPPDRKDITGFSLATVHAISKTMMHEVELTAKNRSGRKIFPKTIGCDPRDFPFYSEILNRNISFLCLSLFFSFLSPSLPPLFPPPLLPLSLFLACSPSLFSPLFFPFFSDFCKMKVGT